MDALENENQANDYALETQLNDNKLKIMFKNSSHPFAELYTLEISSLKQYSKLDEWFTSLREVERHLNLNNYRLHLGTRQVEIIGKVNTQKSKIITLAKLPLKMINKNPVESLQNIIKQCENVNKSSLTSKQLQTQKYISQIASILATVVGNRSIQHIKYQQPQGKIECPVKTQYVEVCQEIKGIKDNIRRMGLDIKEQNVKLNDLVEVVLSEGKMEKTCKYYEEIQRDFQARFKDISNQLQLITEKFGKFNRDFQQYCRIQQANNYMKQESQQVFQFSSQKSMHARKLSSADCAAQRPELGNEINDWINQDLCSKSLHITNIFSILAPRSNGRLISKHVIEDKYRFGIQIISLGQGQIALGIVDPQFIYHRKKIYNATNGDMFVCLSNGSYYHGDTLKPASIRDNRGFKFQENDKIYVEVDMSEGSIEWILQNRRIKQVNKKLVNEKNYWVPFVDIPAKGELFLLI